MSELQRTVLIVDDREENRYTLRHALTRAGFATTEAANGSQALSMSKLLPDVIVLDVRLPDILGYEVCRRLKANPQTRHIPVLQLSAAFLSTESKLYALESGADSYLVQPVDPLVLVATVRSLVRLHQAEKQAQAAARQWAATFDALSEGVAIIHDGTIQRCNRTMTELLDLPYGQIEGQDFAALLRAHFNLASDGDSALDPQNVQVDSRFYRLCTSALPPGEDAPGSIFIVAEITAQKRAEEALLLNERLAATGRMAHIIAHEINNPLEAITNLLYLAETATETNEETRRYLVTASNEVGRVSKISRQILSFHREARAPIPVPIAELVEDVLTLSGGVAKDRELEIRMDLDRTAVVVGLPARLRQVFANILRNAIDASFHGGVISVRVSHSFMRSVDDAIQPAVRITVADTGIGIPLEFRTRIFEAFFTTKEQKGSGVGLWLTSTIVQEHGGRLQLRSRTGDSCSGTCFSLLLPASSDLTAANYS